MGERIKGKEEEGEGVRGEGRGGGIERKKEEERGGGRRGRKRRG